MTNHHGDFIWYELMTTDADAAGAFYQAILPWKVGNQPEYREINATEGGVGGILPLTKEMTEHGARPAWVGYVLVDDVDKTVASVEQGGGQVHMPARDMPGIGRFAMVADPQGAPFYVMRPTPPADDLDKASNAFSYDQPRDGHCAWNELATCDPADALHFYGQRFGWVKDGEMDMGPMGKYEFLRHAGRAPDGSPSGHGMLGAVMPKPPHVPVSGWNFYFRVPDIDVAAAAATANGGRVLHGPIEIPGGDYSMNGLDPQGAAFALVGKRNG
jgi:predicted enzyme related to lactoylglutathione lyase